MTGHAGPDWASWVGLLRSLLIYRARPWHLAKLRRFYRPLLPPDPLCFDIGAHVGDRINVFRSLGARVVAVEPQPLPARWLAWAHGQDPGVTLVRAALGAAAGEAVLQINRHNPTLSTLANGWTAALSRSGRFADQQWDGRVPVPVLTLDRLIEQHGRPDFCKIDAEGSEPDILRGLSQPLPLLSFEFLPETPAATAACLDRLMALGDVRFNLCLGESARWQFKGWIPGVDLRQWLKSAPKQGGDIYARTG